MVFFLLLVMVSFFAVEPVPFLQDVRNSGHEQACQCVPSNLCADNDAAVNGQGLLDIRFQNDICQNYFEVCCENPIGEVNLPDKDTFKGCGYQNPIEIGPRITSNSQTAQFGELPWAIVIMLRDVSKTERNMYRCGGSLVHPQVVITAAHCVSDVDAKHITIRAGEWNTKSQDEPYPHQDRLILETLCHPHYHGGSLKNDIALLFLDEPIVLTQNIGLICLPPSDLQVEEYLCIASGWGKDAFKKGKHSTILRKVDVPLVSKDKCVAALRSTRLGAFYNLHKSFVCAGGERNKDTCKGDGGSPLVCPIPGAAERFFQMGIVSWGIGCGENETPGVYVNVPLFTEWIDKQFNARNLDSSFYKY